MEYFKNGRSHCVEGFAISYVASRQIQVFLSKEGTVIGQGESEEKNSVEIENNSLVVNRGWKGREPTGLLPSRG